MTPDLEARRERATNRALTRTVQHPSEGGLALIEWMRTAPPEMFDTGLVEVRVVREPLSPHLVPQPRDGEEHVEYWVDGVRNHGLRDAVALLQDRYGVTCEEAEELIAAAEVAAPVRSYTRPSSVTPIGR